MLYKLGVKGITYNGSLDGRCFVIFNPKDVKVIRKFYQTIHGKVAFYENQVIIDLFKNANKSTLIHESAHVFLTDLLSAEDEISKKQVELLLKWFKIPDSHSITAQMQEKFARGFEKYLMEGVAPSLELKTVFARFRRWLIAIYKTLFGIDSASGQYINLNPEIRALFDSLIATDEQIRQVQELNALSEPLPKEYFKNEEEYHVYLSRLQEINDNTLDGVIARRFKALQKIRKGRYEQEFQKILNHEKTELAKTFPYNVRIALNKGNLKFYKDSAMSYGYKIPERWLSETGQIPEDIAAIYGLQSADALFEWLLHTPPLRQEAMKRAGQVMYERHGELLSQLSITEGVVRDLYNNARVRQLIEEEIRLYGNKNATPSQVIFEHAVQIATQNVIENSLLGDAQNVRKFAKAALRAAEDFNEVATKNIKHKMIEAKHRQALNASLVNAAYEAEDTISKIEKFFKDIKGREQLIGSKFYEQIKGLLSKHGVWENDFVPGQTFTAFSENLKENGEPTPIVASYLVEGASHNSYWRMTYAEFKDLYNAVKSIYTIGRNHRKMLTNAQKQEITDKALNLVNAIKENDTRSHIKQKDPLHIPTTFEKLKQRLEKLDAWLVKAEQVCLMLDGGKQGEFYNTFYKSLSDAETKKSIELLNIDKSLQKIFANYSAELFDRRFSIDGREMSFKQIFMLGLNWGNAGNREAVLNSTLGLTPVQINFFLSKLTVQDWDVIQAVWDLMEKYKNRSFDLEEKLTGVRPKAIEPVPFTIAGKEYRGGYFPISFDPNLSTIAEDRAFRQAMEGQLMSVRFRPLTQKGFLKERKGTGGQAVQLNSLSLIKRHFDDLITDLNFREIKIDLVRLLKNQELSGVLKNRLSNPVYKELNKWVLDAGLRKTPLNLPDQLFDTLRMNGVRFAMAGNIKVMATQFSGLGATMAEVGATPTLRWLGAYLGSLTTKKNKEYGEFILNRSKFMRLRSREINRDLKEFYELNIGKSKAGILIDKKIEFLLKGIQKCDFIVSSISWRAGYEKAILEGKSEQDAIEYADSVVRLTQGAGRTIDQSRIQRENSTFKIITSFYSVFNVMYNRYRTAFVDIKENRGYVRLIREATYTLMVQSLIESLIRFFFDADKKKPFYKHTLEQLFGQIFSLIPLGINVSYPVGKIISGENIGLVDITPLGFAPVKSSVEALSAFSRGKVTRGIKKSVETFGQTTGFYSRSEMNFIQSLINQISETYFDPLEFINGRKMK